MEFNEELEGQDMDFNLVEMCVPNNVRQCETAGAADIGSEDG
jgi:hypothetical protein